MPDDRFGDLGGDEGARGPRSAGDRFAELDRTRPEEPGPGAGAPAPARPPRRYLWLVGVAFTAFVVIAGVNVVRTSGERSLRGLGPGERVPDFAAPLAVGGPDADVNVKQRPDDPAELGARPACEVRVPGSLNSCELTRRPLVITFFFTQRADCLPLVDTLDRLRGAFPGVNFAAVVGRKSRAEAEQLVRRRGWRLPVMVDRDGALLNLMRVGGCPTTTFVEAGGKVRETALGTLPEAEVRRRVEALPPAGAR